MTDLNVRREDRKDCITTEGSIEKDVEGQSVDEEAAFRRDTTANGLNGEKVGEENFVGDI